MNNKIVSLVEAIKVISCADMVATSGFVGVGTPDYLLHGLEQRFLKTGYPQNLSLVFAAGQGDGKEQGLNRLAHAGLLKRVIGGHWGLIPKIAKLALDNEVEAYNLPQGCISHLFRDIGAAKPGTFSKVGLHTFIDPRHEGGKINQAAKNDLVEIVELNGEEWLFYKAFPIEVAFIRGTSADPDGNISMEKEALELDNLAMAIAAKNSNGIVIAQVERTVERGVLLPRSVHIPGIFVDYVVEADEVHHQQTYDTIYNPSFSGESENTSTAIASMQLNARKVIARRAAKELPIDGVVNLGIGMPEGIASIAHEEDLLKNITLTTEGGSIGGVPASGLDFGASTNLQALILQSQQFDFYDGGGLDMTSLGMAQVDAFGNVNVSRYNGRLTGCGGFINISQNSNKIVFVGTFTAGGLKVEIKNQQLKIIHEGSIRKFINKVEQITFNGSYSQSREQSVLYVTERCVFKMTRLGLELTEIAPGIDLERDILSQMDFQPIINDPKQMDIDLFRDTPSHLN